MAPGSFYLGGASGYFFRVEATKAFIFKLPGIGTRVN
jgi:hypothetical protein